MNDTKQADAPATKNVADADVRTDDQIWAEITGQDADRDNDKTSSRQAEIDSHDNAATDDDSFETADRAVSDDDFGGSGEHPDTQDNVDATKEKRLRGQISGQARKITELQQKIASFANSQGSGKRQTPADIEELRSEYPDIVGPMLDQQEALQEQIDKMSFQLSSIAELQGEQLNASVEQERDALEQAHPGWFQYLKSQGAEFTKWVNDQPASMRAIARSNMDRVVDGEGVSSLLTAYKIHRGEDDPNQSAPNGAHVNRDLTSKRKRQLAGARAISSRGTQAATIDPQPGETDAQAIWDRITKS